jgi:hypothetical protein
MTPRRELTGPVETEPSSDRYWGIDDIASFLNVSRRGVERHKSSGRMPRPTLTVGRLPRWNPATIRAWAEGGAR